MSQITTIEKKVVSEDEEKEYADRMVIRSFSSMILLIPSFLTVLICGIIQLIFNRIRGLDFDGHMSVLGIIFFSIFTLNLFIIAFDFNRARTILMVVAFIAIGATILLVNAYTDFITEYILPFIPEIRLWMSTQFYFAFAFILGLILFFTWIGTFFNYYVIEGNELIHHKGWGAGDDHYPATNMKVSKEFPDLIELLFFRAGTLVLSPPRTERSLVLTNVFFVNKKVDEMNEILSRLKVDVD